MDKMMNKLIWLILVMPMAFVNGQDIGIRFSNPAFDCDTRTYCLDVEYMSNTSVDTMYGTNVRFFYNSTELSFIALQDFTPGYGVSVVPAPQTGVASSGADLFNFDAGEAATWVNGAVELQNLSLGLLIGNGQWTKFYQACFSVVGNPEDVDNFCPELVWDLEQNPANGGFFPGDNGVVITLKSSLQSRSSNEQVEHFNWTYSGNGTAPYGDYSQSTGGCLTTECVCSIISPTIIISGN